MNIIYRIFIVYRKILEPVTSFNKAGKTLVSEDVSLFILLQACFWAVLLIS